MANFLGTSLAAGQVANSKSTIYTVPAGKVAYIRWGSFHNTNATIQVLVLYVRRNGGSSRIIDRAQLEQSWTGTSFQDSSLELSAGDLLEAVTTTASAVDFVLSGALEDE